MADELDIEAMLEAPYRKVRLSVCPHCAPHSARLCSSTHLRDPSIVQPISTHTFPICVKAVHDLFGFGPFTPVDPICLPLNEDVKYKTKPRKSRWTNCCLFTKYMLNIFF